MKFLTKITLLLVILNCTMCVKLRQNATAQDQLQVSPVVEEHKDDVHLVANNEVKTDKLVVESVAKEVKEEATPQTQSEAKTEAKTETEVTTAAPTITAAPLTHPPLGFLVNAPPAQPHPEENITKMDVLDNNGNVKTIRVHDDQKDLENAQQCKADLLNTPVYQLCKNLKCDECLNTVDCGFCGDGRCLPGNLEGAHCPGDCLNNWFFHDITKCPREILAGKFTNVAPEATHLINPEITEAKIKTVTKDAPDVRMGVTLITGEIVQHATSSVLNPDGSVDQFETSKSKPLTSELVRAAPTDGTVETAITSQTTGERLDTPDTLLVNHGVDQVQHDPRANSF